MNQGCYLLFPDHKPPRLVAVTKISSSEVEYEWLEQGCLKRGILTKYSHESSADLGVHEGKRVFGIINEATSLQKLQSAFAEFVTELNAKKEAARALEREREAQEQAKREVDRALERERILREQAKKEVDRVSPDNRAQGISIEPFLRSPSACWQKARKPPKQRPTTISVRRRRRIVHPIPRRRRWRGNGNSTRRKRRG